ncbi:MAG TPA: hypothetical protein VF434_09565 [Promineifilum sp.]
MRYTALRFRPRPVAGIIARDLENRGRRRSMHDPLPIQVWRDLSAAAGHAQTAGAWARFEHGDLVSEMGQKALMPAGYSPPLPAT